MGRFPFFKRLLLVIILWLTKVTTGRRILSQTEGEWNDFKITDRFPPGGPLNLSDLGGSPTWSGSLKNVTAHKMEKAIITFPNPSLCDRNRVGRKVESNLTAIIVAKIKEIKVNPEESGCQTSVLSELLNITEVLFSYSRYCTPPWARITGNNLRGNASPAVFNHSSTLNRARSLSVWVQEGRDGKWADASKSNITGTDARYLLNMIAGFGSNRTFGLAILMDHFIIIDDLLDEAVNNTQEVYVAGAGQGRTGHLFLRVYMPIKNGTTNKSSDLETLVHNITFNLNFTECDDHDISIVEKFFKDVIDNGWTAPPKPSPEPSPKPDVSGDAAVPWFVYLYFVLLTLMVVLSIVGVIWIKCINKSWNGTIY